MQTFPATDANRKIVITVVTLCGAIALAFFFLDLREPWSAGLQAGKILIPAVVVLFLTPRNYVLNAHDVTVACFLGCRRIPLNTITEIEVMPLRRLPWLKWTGRASVRLRLSASSTATLYPAEPKKLAEALSAACHLQPHILFPALWSGNAGKPAAAAELPKK